MRAGPAGELLADAGAVVVSLVALFGLLELIEDWSKLATYAAAAGFMVVSLIPTMVWVEMAPDGAFRRRARD